MSGLCRYFSLLLVCWTGTDRIGVDYLDHLFVSYLVCVPLSFLSCTHCIPYAHESGIVAPILTSLVVDGSSWEATWYAMLCFAICNDIF